jgi:hypothetical protein
MSEKKRENIMDNESYFSFSNEFDGIDAETMKLHFKGLSLKSK